MFTLRQEVLIIKNSENEGPGSIEEYLTSRSIKFQLVDAGHGQAIPPVARFAALIILGGTMGVYEMDRYPHLKRVASVINDAIELGIPVLGICLGAQLIANVLGNKVYKGPKKEIGWRKISPTPFAHEDKVFSSILEPFGDTVVFQYHNDTFDLPHGAVRLASSRMYQNQAFRYGSNCYALQFHLEVTPSMIHHWCSDMASYGRIERQTKIWYSRYRIKAFRFYERFFSLG